MDLFWWGGREEKVSITHMRLPHKNEKQIYFSLQKRKFSDRENKGPKNRHAAFFQILLPPSCRQVQALESFFPFLPAQPSSFLRKEIRSVNCEGCWCHFCEKEAVCVAIQVGFMNWLKGLFLLVLVQIWKYCILRRSLTKICSCSWQLLLHLQEEEEEWGGTNKDE